MHSCIFYFSELVPYLDLFFRLCVYTEDGQYRFVLINLAAILDVCTLENWNTHYNYMPEDHISIKVLMGDRGDNVPGIEGVGIKRAETLVKEYGSAYDIYAMIPINSTYKYMKNLNAFKENILLNYELMDLCTYCEEAIGEHLAGLKLELEDL